VASQQKSGRKNTLGGLSDIRRGKGEMVSGNTMKKGIVIQRGNVYLWELVESAT